MNTLYIDRKNSRLSVRANALELRENNQLSQRIPLRMLKRIVIIGNVQTGSSDLTALAEAGISVALLGGRQHRHRATLIGPLKKDGQRRLAQYRACVDPETTRAIALCLLKRKLAGQQRLLRQALNQRPDQRLILKKSGAELNHARKRLNEAGLSLDTLRGIEGAAAAAYFKAYGRLLPPEANFTGRKRRPPPDPVNAALSLGYTLLYGEAVSALHAAGLDPALGYLHEPAHGRESPAADLIEPLRPRHDRLVWRLFARRKLNVTHFDQRDGGYWLGKQGRAIFFAHYATIAGPARRWLRLYIQALIRQMKEPPAP